MATFSAEQAQIVPERAARRGRALKSRLANGGALILLIILALIWLLPLLWTVDTAFKPEGETTIIPISWIPWHFTLDAFALTFSSTSLPRWYLNSVITSGLLTIFTVVLASMAAFALS